MSQAQFRKKTEELAKKKEGCSQGLKILAERQGNRPFFCRGPEWTRRLGEWANSIGLVHSPPVRAEWLVRSVPKQKVPPESNMVVSSGARSLRRAQLHASIGSEATA